MKSRSRLWLGCGLLFLLNVFLVHRLFGIEYLDQFQSNEGSFVTFGKFLHDHWPHIKWFPWYDGGMPFENTYFPLTAILTALTSALTGWSAAHSFHFIAALTYASAPSLLALFLFELSGCLAPSIGAGLLWSLASPALIFSDLRRDMGGIGGIRRLENLIVYGEMPHNLALCLLPVAVFLILRFFREPSIRRFCAAALFAALLITSNAFGVVTLGLCAIALALSLEKAVWRNMAASIGIVIIAWLAVCRALTPSLLLLIRKNSQTVGGDFRFTPRSMMLALVLIVVLVLLSIAVRRVRTPVLRFAILTTGCFGAITAMGLHGMSIVPQPVRYHLEMEIGICILVSFLIWMTLEKTPRLRAAALVTAGVILVFVALRDYRFSRSILKPADIANSIAMRESTWIGSHLPGQRVLVSGEDQWLLNLFSENSQLSAGHEPSAPNWVQAVAVYTIYTGQNAGNDDGPISVLWLKAFGCGAVVVPGPASLDHYHSIANPAKFGGLLPLLWQDHGDSIYGIPSRSASLAHVIPRAAMVMTRPVNGLDVAGVRAYVNALENPANPEATFAWRNPDQAVIQAKVPTSSVLSVQETWDPGWTAHVGDRKVPVKNDGLGLITIEPGCGGSECTVNLDFTGGAERNVTLAISLITAFASGLGLFYRGSKRIPQ